MFDQSIVTIEDLIKVAEEQAKTEEKSEYKEEEKKEEEKKEEKSSKEEAEKTAAVLEAFADFIEKVADELPLDLAPVPGEQKKTQDTPIAEHDISAGGKTVDNEMETDERKPVKETQGHLGQPQKPFVPITPDAPGVQGAPAKQEGPSKTAGYLRQLQMTKLSEEGVPAGQLGYDSNAQAAHDRSEELLTEPNQVGMTQATESSGKVDKNQQAVDDTPGDLATGPKKDMKQLLEEPMQSKKHDKVLADALPTMEPQAKPKVAELLASIQKEAKKDPEAKALAKAEKSRAKELYKAEKAKGLEALKKAKGDYKSKTTWSTRHPAASSVIPFSGSTTSEAKGALKAMGKLKDAPWAVRHPGAAKALGTAGGATVGAALGGPFGPAAATAGGAIGGALGYGGTALGTSLAAKKQMRKATMGKYAEELEDFKKAKDDYKSKTTWSTRHPVAASVIPFSGSPASEAKGALKAMGKLEDAPWAVRHPGATQALGTAAGIVGGATLGAVLGGLAGEAYGPAGASAGGTIGGALGYGGTTLGTFLAAKKQMRKATMGKYASDDHAISNFLRARQLEMIEEE